MFTGSFVNGIAEGPIDGELHELDAMRLVVHAASDAWVILSEVSVLFPTHSLCPYAVNPPSCRKYSVKQKREHGQFSDLGSQLQTAMASLGRVKISTQFRIK